MPIVKKIAIVLSWDLMKECPVKNSFFFLSNVFCIHKVPNINPIPVNKNTMENFEMINVRITTRMFEANKILKSVFTKKRMLMMKPMEIRAKNIVEENIMLDQRKLSVLMSDSERSASFNDLMKITTTSF